MALGARPQLLALLLAAVTTSGALAETEGEIAALKAAAEEGSAAAMMRLGTIHDFGLGVPRDPSRAMRWFLAAAEAGSVAAAFNVGVLLDAGVGQAGRDAAGAAIWYARAALSGHARARYNLGLLYEAGDGVPQNAAQARYWYGLAGDEVPTAAARAAALPMVPETPAGRLSAPDIVHVGVQDQTGVQLVWTVPPGPVGMMYRGELWHDADGVAKLAAHVETPGAAAVLSMDRSQGGALVRVVAIDRVGEDYAASQWHRIGETPPSPPSVGVVFLVGAQDASAGRLARSMAANLGSGGVASQVVIEDRPLPDRETGVHFSFDRDEGFAADIAAVLPGQVQVGPGRAAVGMGPGMIEVRLVGGLSDGAVRAHAAQ